MKQFNPNAISFDLSNALMLAKASRLAYDSDKNISGTVQGGWKLPKYKFLKAEDTQGYIAGDSEIILIAFRGTEREEIKDWLTDADCRFKQNPWGRVHTGFQEALDCCWDDLITQLSNFQDNEQKIWVTGHSLGAALAVLAAAKLAQEGMELMGLYNFGQPRVGDKEFARNFDKNLKKRTYRFVNNNDIVPRVPPRRKMGYADVGQIKYFNIFGKLYDDPKTWGLFLDSLAGMAESALSRFTELKSELAKYALMDCVDDHDIKNYITNIEGLIKS